LCRQSLLRNPVVRHNGTCDRKAARRVPAPPRRLSPSRPGWRWCGRHEADGGREQHAVGGRWPEFLWKKTRTPLVRVDAQLFYREGGLPEHPPKVCTVFDVTTGPAKPPPQPSARCRCWTCAPVSSGPPTAWQPLHPASQVAGLALFIRGPTTESWITAGTSISANVLTLALCISRNHRYRLTSPTMNLQDTLRLCKGGRKLGNNSDARHEGSLAKRSVAHRRRPARATRRRRVGHGSWTDDGAGVVRQWTCRCGHWTVRAAHVPASHTQWLREEAWSGGRAIFIADQTGSPRRTRGPGEDSVGVIAARSTGTTIVDLALIPSWVWARLRPQSRRGRVRRV
jgi:hypothetical protein